MWCVAFISNLGAQVKVYETFDQMEQEILNNHNDTLYIVNFWATWCKPCVAELPYLDKLHSQYQHQKVKVVLVSLDAVKSLENKVKPFLISRNIESQVVLLADTKANDWIDKVSVEWSGSIPATLFYSDDNRIFKEQEFENYEEIKNIVETFLNP